MMPEGDIWTSLVHVLAGASTPEDERRVEQWLGENPEHPRLMALLRQIWEASGTPQGDWPSETADDLDARWQTFLEQAREEVPVRPPARGVPLQPRERPAASRRRFGSPARQLLRVAVVLLVLAGGVWLATSLMPERAAESVPLAWQEVTTEPGQRATVQLGDGTQVQLNVDSKLRFVSGFAPDQREVFLEGEAFFDVARDEHRPFVIHTGEAVVAVLGTAFSLRAYDDEPGVEVVVAEGAVSLRAAEAAVADTVVLRPGQLGRLPGDASPLVRRDVALGAYLAWTEGRLVFQDAPLDEVARQLERWYKLQVDLAVAPEAVDRLNASFGDESLSQILNAISASLNLEYTRTRRHVTFRPVDATPP